MISNVIFHICHSLRLLLTNSQLETDIKNLIWPPDVCWRHSILMFFFCNPTSIIPDRGAHLSRSLSAFEAILFGSVMLFVVYWVCFGSVSVQHKTVFSYNVFTIYTRRSTVTSQHPHASVMLKILHTQVSYWWGRLRYDLYSINELRHSLYLTIIGDSVRVFFVFSKKFVESF